MAYDILTRGDVSSCMAACKWVKVRASGISAKSSSMPQFEFCSTTTDDCLRSELACCANGQLILFFVLPIYVKIQQNPIENRNTLISIYNL